MELRETMDACTDPTSTGFNPISDRRFTSCAPKNLSQGRQNDLIQEGDGER